MNERFDMGRFYVAFAPNGFVVLGSGCDKCHLVYLGGVLV